jgi:predicted ABC-type ATPase
VNQQNKICTIIGGPNGSGKSTVYDLLRPIGQFVNADVIARQIDPRDPEGVSISAGREALNQLSQLMAAGKSLVYETTLSSRQSLRLMEHCHSSGYQISLLFIALENAELHVRRVQERVKLGGHHIAADAITRRYESSFENLPRAMALADEVLLVDNTGLEPALVIAMASGIVTTNDLLPGNGLHRRFALALQRSAQLREQQSS